MENDNRFEFHDTREIVVPADYDHATCLDSFRRKFGDKFFYFNPNITDNNFRNVTTKLAPGQRFEVQIFQIKERVSPKDCVAFLETQGAALTGAQGASLAWEFFRKSLPEGEWYVSFDKKDALWRDANGFHRVPNFYRRPDVSWHFDLGYFEGKWGGNFSLFCFRSLSML